jgi:hypothetical protein
VLGIQIIAFKTKNKKRVAAKECWSCRIIPSKCLVSEFRICFVCVNVNEKKKKKNKVLKSQVASCWMGISSSVSSSSSSSSSSSFLICFVKEDVFEIVAGPSPYASSSSSSSSPSSSEESESSCVAEEEETVPSKRIKSAHEVEVIECPDAPLLEPNIEIRTAGVVQSLVGSLIVVKATGSMALNIGTVICLESSREVIGIIEEVCVFASLFVFFILSAS